MARAGLNKFCPRATILLILSANAPDIDIVALAKGPLKYFEIHRGYTHSLVGLPFMALITVLVVTALSRQRLAWTRAFALCILGVASHLLLDWTNDYGIRLLLPFSSSWSALDITSLYDWVIWAVLLFAGFWPLLERLVNGEIGVKGPAGRGVAIFALVFFLAYDFGRALMHNRAVAQLQSVLYEGAAAVRAAALPNPLNPFRWKGIVETSRDFRVIPVDALGDFEPRNAQVFYKLSVTRELKTACDTDPFSYFLYFARFPVWSMDRIGTGTPPLTQVHLMDLRFGVPGSSRFHCTAIEEERGRLLKAEFVP